MIQEVLHHAHHVTLAGVLFRNFRHSSMSIAALKRFYADQGLLPDEDAELELVKLNSVEEMCEFLSGPTMLVCGQMFEEEPQHGDMTL